MKKVIFPALIFFATSCLAQSEAQATGSANTGATASAGQSSVQVEGNANTSASGSANGRRSGQNGGEVNQNSNGNGNASGNMSMPGEASGAAGLATGNTISAVLSKPVDARKNKEGDPVMARTIQNVKAGGETIIPKGSRLLGHVTQARPRAKGESDSELGIVFDQALLKNGKQIPLHTVIQAIGSSQTAASSNDVDMMSDVGGAARVSRPAGGNISGGMLGGVGSTVGGVANTAGNLAGSAAGSVNNTVGGTVNAVGAAGTLTSNSGGVFGLSGLTLNSVASNATQGSVITSTGRNVHLDSGTQLILRVVQ